MDDLYNYTRVLRQLIVSYIITIIVFVITPLGIGVLSRGLSLSEFGVYSLFFTFWNIGLHAFPQGLQLFVQNYLPGRAVSEQWVVVGSVMRWNILCVSFFGFVWVVFGGYALSWLNIGEFYYESLLVVFASIILAVGFVPHAWLNARQELEFTNVLYGINSTVWIIASVIEFFLFGRIVLWHIFLYWVAGAALQFCLTLLKLGKEGKYLILPLEINKSIIIKGLIFGFPLLLLSGSQWFLTSFDKVLLAKVIGKDSLGLYSLAYALCGIVFSFGNVVSTMFYPYIAKAWNVKNNAQYNLLWNAALKYTLFLVLPGMVGVFVLREPLILLIGGEKFLFAGGVVRYLILFPLFASLIAVVQITLLVREKSFVIGIAYFTGIILNYFLNLILVKQFGIWGAVGATIVTYFIILCFLFRLSWKYLSFKLGFVKVGRIIVASLGMGVVLMLFDPQDFFSKVATFFLGVFVYSFMLLVLKVFGKEEWSVVKSLFSRRGDHNI